MAEFGELLPGTEWRTPVGRRVRVLADRVAVECPDTPESRRLTTVYGVGVFESWVPWVEPIAVGDTVTTDAWSIPPRTVLGLFTTPGGIEMAVLTSPCGPDAYHFCLASECRKVNDE